MTRICPCRGRIGTFTPTMSPRPGVQTPEASTTFLVAMLPLLVSTLCTAPFLTAIPVTAVRLKVFAPFWRASSARPKHRRMGLSLASPLKLRQAMTLSETCGSWRSSSSRSQKVTSTPSFFLPS